VIGYYFDIIVFEDLISLLSLN